MHGGVKFEQHVHRIARQLWPSAIGGAANVDGRERDGIYVTDDIVFAIECTISSKVDKIRSDIAKLKALIPVLQEKYPHKAIRGYCITKDEPTASQRDEIKNSKSKAIILQSFDEFKSRIVNPPHYIELRSNYQFGSMTKDFKRSEYVNLDLIDTNGSIYSVDDILAEIFGENTHKLALVGEYGAGKSTTLRIIYDSLVSIFQRGESFLFPLFLNLRDHLGQIDPAEALQRHCTRIGYEKPEQIIRAWRAGFCILILDGFDEIGVLGIQGRGRKLTNIRYQSMELIRKFVSQSPSDCPIIIAGRYHYFDSDEEMRRSLNFYNEDIVLHLSEFSDKQISEFLRKSNFSGEVPFWLPARPLLLGYLLRRGLLGSNGISLLDNDPSTSWDRLISLVCQREADIEAGIDGATLRHLLERLATLARTKQDGLGPISMPEIEQTFREVCGYSPDDRAMVLLQRLPGLGVDSDAEGTRRFIDATLHQICSSADLITFIGYPYKVPTEYFSLISVPIGSTALAHIVLKIIGDANLKAKVNEALRVSTQSGLNYVGFDLANICMTLDMKSLETNVVVSSVFSDRFLLGSLDSDFHNLTFHQCYFNAIEIDDGIESSRLPRFSECIVGEIDGRLGMADLPESVFESDCEIESFTKLEKTTSSILSSRLDYPVKVLLSVLKKLFFQPGGGRRENAFFRGLDAREQRLVPDILQILQRFDFATCSRSGSNDIWKPHRKQSARASQIMAAPNSSKDEVICSVRKMASS